VPVGATSTPVPSRSVINSRTLPEGEQMDKLLYRVPEAAAALSLSRAKIYELIRSGVLRPVRVDGSRRCQGRRPEGLRRCPASGVKAGVSDGIVKRGSTWSYVNRVVETPRPA
jgi:excisionase family DNA binding protein